MTAPANNDAALVRQARAFCDALVEEGTLGRAAIVNSLVIRLAATAERADELAAQADRAGHEAAKLYERTEAAEAALLAAQQDATRWQNRATLLGQERQRAEATITRLQGALERGAEQGETPEIRAWCSRLLADADERGQA